MSEKLLPCPFCGPGQSMVDPWFDDVSKRWAIGCGRCGASSGRSVHAEGSREAAVKSWNTRGLAEPAPAPLAGREEIARIIRKALVENWRDESGAQWDEDVLLTGCRNVGSRRGYRSPETAAQNLALDAADAILALSTVTPHERWQPIETAPKDGTSVLLYEEFEPTICQGWWTGEIWKPSRGPWFFQQPTHWQPLPVKPALPRAHAAATPPHERCEEDAK